MIDFLSISISNVILIFLIITILILFCLYLYADNKVLKKEIEELRKENKELLEKKIIKKENTDAISIKSISNEKTNNINNKKLENNNIEDQYINTNMKPVQTKFNLKEYINKNDNYSKKETKIEDKYDYLQDISNKISEELKPQTIELTDYEKKQEEQAVISYKELLKYKSNEQISSEKQDTINFIEELKKLRSSLK